MAQMHHTGGNDTNNDSWRELSGDAEFSTASNAAKQQTPDSIPSSDLTESDSAFHAAGLLDRLISKLYAIDEKLRTLQLQNLELQHSCSAVTEIARVALSESNIGNPFLSKIEDILTRKGDSLETDEMFVQTSNVVKHACDEINKASERLAKP